MSALRKIAFYEAEIDYLQERIGFWHNKFRNEPANQLAAIRNLQQSINKYKQLLIYWQAVYSDEVQS